MKTTGVNLALLIFHENSSLIEYVYFVVHVGHVMLWIIKSTRIGRKHH